MIYRYSITESAAEGLKIRAKTTEGENLTFDSIEELDYAICQYSKAELAIKELREITEPMVKYLDN